ncbi:imidazole glycerol phosphate synthase subunit HisF [Clostridium acetireducens DSM 10703]|uniref:Imidazole glycerol phosphate synthase subunit HisF n=1 Tax=Clostridium acetireducens DSM 10703 TaxID=1121290 RepID=A0A1E8EX43_9CLOT|nr:imidazole glycerol phosphate synthase subunit HisF [Clostridium acetireducens]OFI05362.1 imidazole glycerol phosphate synthase subunit HisF [Clostridium acetireducens DSM 10703]
MITKRIIPCLDVEGGRVVKGVNFVNLKDVGDPVEIAEFYNKEGADELVFLDINATNEKRKTMIEVIKKTAEKVSIPFTVGGGIRTIEDIREVLKAGADKVSINSAAIKNTELISEAANKFGSQCIVVAVDAISRKDDSGWNVVINGGRIDTNIDLIQWVKKVEKLGAGEILLTSKDADGTKNGYDINMTKAVAQAVNIPVIASGGCGKLEDFKQVFSETNVDAALAASIFHYRELSIKEVKEYLMNNGISARV